MAKAKVARFYGWTDREISNLQLTKFAAYWHAITGLEAQEWIYWSEISAFPNLKTSKQRSLLQRYRKKTRHRMESDSEVKSLQDLAVELARGIGG